ncbi:MAG TPA: hypothetical protein VF723_14420 [Pyrinomonadaceae bacterium]
MLSKKFTSLLVGAAVLLTVMPSKAFGQTLTQAKTAESTQALGGTLVSPKPGLKAVFDREIADAKARASRTLDYRRIDQASRQGASSSWTKREKIGFIVLVGVILVVTTALLIHGINTSPSCADDPTHPNCIP